jgi:Ca-activated chloride channel family protein
MKVKMFTLTLGLVLTAFSLALAQGYIIPQPIPRYPRPVPLKLAYQRVDVKINERAAETTIEQEFLNDTPYRLEGYYIFPLPKGASVSEFNLWIDGEKVKGELLDSRKARQIYEDIVRRLRDPGLLEWAGSGLFRARVFPISPHGRRRISIKYLEVLPFDGSFVSYRLPLRRREDSYPLSEFTLTADVRSKLPLKTIYSPSHDVAVERFTENRARVSFELEKEIPDKDFRLYYSFASGDFGASLLTYREEDEPGFFLLALTPKYKFKREEIAAKDIIFVLDTSGSMMTDDKIGKALSALRFGVSGLNEDDRFTIVTFASSVRSFSETLLPATDGNKRKARSFLQDVSAGGGTNIHDALLSAIDLFGERNRPKILVFLTDGMPTVGVTDTAKIVADVTGKADEEVRLFSFGVGYGVNAPLLDELSTKNRGDSAYIKPDEELETRVSAFFEKVNFPVLSDPKLDFGGIKVSDLFPGRIPDFFKGSQLIVTGRYRGSGKTTLILSGKVEGKKKRFHYQLSFPKESESASFIPRLWASRKIGYLLAEIRLHGEDPELKEEVIRLSKSYGIITPYTSYLIVEEEKRRLGGRSGEWGRALAPQADKIAEAKEAMEKESGKAAVDTSVHFKALQKGKLEEEAFAQVKEVAGKVFYLKNGIWVDSLYKKDMKEQRIEYASKGYFDFVFAHPELASCFSLGKEVIVVVEGKAIRVFEAIK